jgi:hypothetical protein
MFSRVLILVALLNVTIDAQVSTRDERDFGNPGAMSVEQLRQEPITFQLDIPQAG